MSKLAESLHPSARRLSVSHRRVSGRRIVLVEDTWVSGSPAVSTAIALRRAGAAAIVLTPIARKADADAMTDEYAAATAGPSRWTDEW